MGESVSWACRTDAVFDLVFSVWFSQLHLGLVMHDEDELANKTREALLMLIHFTYNCLLQRMCVRGRLRRQLAPRTSCSGSALLTTSSVSSSVHINEDLGKRVAKKVVSCRVCFSSPLSDGAFYLC